MLVVSRFRYDGGEVDRALAELGTCLELLGQAPGFASGTVGRAIDDPTLWVFSTTWHDVASYRRALSSYDAKAAVAPILSRAIDEPSAYEPLAGVGASEAVEPNEAKPRGTG